MKLDRRDFLKTSSALAVLSALPAQASTRLPIRMAVEYNMLPKELSILDRFQLARDCGFAAIECPTTPDPAAAEQMRVASIRAALPIHSVMNMDHWAHPFTSPDPAEVERGLEGARTSIRNAHLWGASTVLLVPGVVTPQVSYEQAYTRSQTVIRTLLPLAEQLNVTLALEEVWNKFLLSPLEFARYIDSFQSPRIRAYFDVGNVVLYGYPQDWIRILGPRIVKLHIKDFIFQRDKATGVSTARWVSLGEGEIDWLAVYQALADIHYKGDATLELASGDPAYLRDMQHRFTQIVSGESLRKTS